MSIKTKAKTVSFDEIYNSMPEERKRDIEARRKYYQALFSLRETRKKLGLSQEELSTKSGIPRPTISKIESGDRNVGIETLMSLAKAMGKQVEIRLV